MTQMVELTGECAWAHKMLKPDEKFKRWTINMYLDKDSWETFDKLGLMNEVRKDEDGREYVVFGRPTTKLMGEKLVKFDAPKIWQNKKPFEGKVIANGSNVTVRLTVYKTIKGMASRIEDMRINKLAEMPDSDDYVRELAPF